jgi:hypothetical protein
VALSIGGGAPKRRAEARIDRAKASAAQRIDGWMGAKRRPSRRRFGAIGYSNLSVIGPVF